MLNFLSGWDLAWHFSCIIFWVSYVTLETKLKFKNRTTILLGSFMYKKYWNSRHVESPWWFIYPWLLCKDIAFVHTKGCMWGIQLHIHFLSNIMNLGKHKKICTPFEGNIDPMHVSANIIFNSCSVVIIWMEHIKLEPILIPNNIKMFPLLRNYVIKWGTMVLATKHFIEDIKQINNDNFDPGDIQNLLPVSFAVAWKRVFLFFLLATPYITSGKCRSEMKTHKDSL